MNSSVRDRMQAFAINLRTYVVNYKSAKWQQLWAVFMQQAVTFVGKSTSGYKMGYLIAFQNGLQLQLCRFPTEALISSNSHEVGRVFFFVDEIIENKTTVLSNNYI